MANLFLEDVFMVERLDPDGKKFDKVNRIEARSERNDLYMQLDVNTEIYPIRPGEKYAVAFATTLDLEGTPDTGYYNPGMRKSLADKYEYVMHGKLYKFAEQGSGPNVKTEMYISFGGLLMLLRGGAENFNKFSLDQRLFLLMRKTT